MGTIEALTPQMLKQTIYQIRKARGAAFEKHNCIAQATAKVLSYVGEFYHGDDNLLRYFNSEKCDIQLLRSRNFEVYLSGLTGLNGTEEAYKYVYRHLENIAHLQPLVPIHTLTWYDEATGELRRFMGRGKVLRRLPHGTWTAINNGADGIIFHDDLVDPCEPDFESNGALDWFKSQLLLSRSGDLTFDERWDAYLIWLIQQHFPSLRRMRLVLAAIGEPESGKTSLIRDTGRVLQGPHFNETSTSKQDAFQAMLGSNAVSALDNWDSFHDWFKGALNLYVTGATETLRELYSTIDQRVLIPRAILMLSSNSPKFRATDISQRLLIIDMEKPTPPDGQAFKVKAEHKIKAEFAERWPRIMGELLTLVGKIADSYRDAAAPELDFRAADYAELAHHYYRVVAPDRPNAAPELIEKLKRKQSDFASKDDPLLEALRVLIDATYRLKPIGIPAAEAECSSELNEETGLGLMELREVSSGEGTIGPVSAAVLAHLREVVGEKLRIRMPWRSVKAFNDYFSRSKQAIQTQFNARVSDESGHARERKLTISVAKECR